MNFDLKFSKSCFVSGLEIFAVFVLANAATTGPRWQAEEGPTLAADRFVALRSSKDWSCHTDELVFENCVVFSSVAGKVFSFFKVLGGEFSANVGFFFVYLDPNSGRNFGLTQKIWI